MTKAEEIYHRFVQYEWNEIGEGMKKSILDAINEALRQPPVSGSLPTDKEIETWATYECGGCSQESNDERIGLIRGAKWMRRQILKA